MHIKIKALILSGLLLVAAAVLSGAYLRNQPVYLSQPDGTKLDLYASGDEYYNWLHDKEGYTVKQNDQGWYVYLVNTADNELSFTDHVVGQVDPAKVNLLPWANITPEEMGQIREKAQLQLREIGSGRAPSTGTLNNISIFIRFSDQTEFGQNLSTYSSMFNGTAGNTMQSYFLEASYNTLNISTSFYPTPSTTVVSWQDSHPRAYYSPYSASNTIGYSGDSQRTDREFTLLVNAVNGVSSQIPTSLVIDADNDGKVDNVCFIIKGGSDGWAELLWPHRWSLYDRTVRINGKRVYDFNFQLADFLASSGVGVICHEMFHSLSAPDLYHYTGNGISPVGPWDLMENNANPPQHMGAYMKYKYGHWISSIPTISTAGTYTLNPLTSSTGQCYRINSPNSSSEYFVVEFRKKTGTFENSLPGSGMLIYRINPAYDGNADGPPDEVYLFRPGGSPTANGTVNSANFSTQTSRTSFSNTSNPYGFLSNGTLGGISLSAISSSAGSTMTFNYNLSNAPINLAGVSFMGTVLLNWEAPLSGTPSSYKIYRNSSYIGSSAVLNYSDSAVTVGQTYSYRVTAIFSNPASESGPSNTVSVTVSSNASMVLGSGTSFTTTQAACPINIYYRSLHGQSVYTKAELNAAGVFGPINITQAGFYVNTVPTLALPNFIIRMKHTTDANVANWQTSTGITTVYSATPYMPTAGSYNMLTFSTPFTWNGIDNLVIDTAFNQVANYSSTGTVQFTSIANGYRFARSDSANQTSVFTGGSTSSYRPNVKLTFAAPLGPQITVTPTSLAYGPIAVNSSSLQQFTLQNTGDQTLTGSIVTPTGYSVSLSTRREEETAVAGTAKNVARNTLGFSIAAGSTAVYNLTFTPTAVTSYNGNLIITSNDTAHPSMNIAVNGSGYIPPTISLNNTELAAALHTNETGTDTFTISNTGSQALNYTISAELAAVWFTASPSSGTVAGGGNQLITGSFNAAGLNPGTYQTTLQISSNDPVNPLLELRVTLEVLSYAPTIILPDEFTFDMNGSLLVDFSLYVDDQDGQALSLAYAGNSNILLAIDGLLVTFSAVDDWSGSEELSFTVSDGTDQATDSVIVTVNLTFLAQPEITALSRTAGGVLIQWNSVPNASFYEIHRSPEPNGAYSLLGSTDLNIYEDLESLPMAFYKIFAISGVPAK